jgi:predicted acylesterase/phospholipase RssA
MVKYLSIGPGAMGFYVYLGAISKLKDHKIIKDDLEEISGASAGALLGFLYCLMKGDIKNILEYSLKIPVNNLMKINIKSLLKNYGLVPLKNIRKVLSEMCEREMKQTDINFRELYDYFPIKLHVSSYCVQIEKTKYFSVDTTPEASILDAVCASIAIPFIFSTVKMDDGMNYIDGGAVESTPSGVFVSKNDVLAIKLGWEGWSLNIKDLKSYAMSLLYANMKLRYNYEIPTWNLSCDSEVFNFGASSESKIRMYMAGYSQEFSG